jgi:protein-S-isoprenylcysteine O-methyltransferase Ste14
MKTSISDQTSPNSINGTSDVNAASNRVGGWLFRHRTSIPLPVALGIVFLRVGEAPRSLMLASLGVVVTLLGEALRFWGVHHIGVISRTRSERLGPLIDSGPFAIVRNPLYLGNISLWVGFALTAHLVWLAPIIVVLLGLEYHAIVRWEEQLLESRLGSAYCAYAARVNRWLPAFNPRDRSAPGAAADQAPSEVRSEHVGRSEAKRERYSWRDTLFSERGTLIAIAAGYLLLWLKVNL